MSAVEPTAERRDEQRHRQEKEDRHHTLVRLLTYAFRHRVGTVKFVDMVEELGLEAELWEMTVGHPKRHRRIKAAHRLLRLQKQALHRGQSVRANKPSSP